MPGSGICMWPPLSLWLTIIGRCNAGVLRLISQIESGRRGIRMPELWGKLTFPQNLRCHALDEIIWLREEDRLGDFTRATRLQNHVGTKKIAMDALNLGLTDRPRSRGVTPESGWKGHYALGRSSSMDTAPLASSVNHRRPFVFLLLLFACTARGLRRKKGSQRGIKERTKGADRDYNYNQLLSRCNHSC